MRVLVFYEVGDLHPWDYRHLDGDELFNELVKKERIVRMYLVDEYLGLDEFADDYNSEFFDHSGFWCQLVNVSEETFNNYKNS